MKPMGLYYIYNLLSLSNEKDLEPKWHIIIWPYHVFQLIKLGKLEETTTSNVHFPLNLNDPFCAYAFSLKFLLVFLNVHTGVKRYLSLIYTMYANPSNNTPTCTHIIMYLVGQVHLLGGFLLYKLRINW